MAGAKDAVTLLGPISIVVVSFITVIGLIFGTPSSDPPTNGLSGDCVSANPGADDGQGPMNGIHPVAATALRRVGITGGMITQGLGHYGKSSGTHGHIPGSPYGAAADIKVGGMSEATIKQTVHNLRMQGFVTWYREPGWDGPGTGNAHIHAAFAGLPPPNNDGRNIAAGQIQTFLNSESRRRNGLADGSGRNPSNFPLDTFPTTEELASVRSVYQGGSGCVGTQTGTSSLESRELPVSSGKSCTEMSLSSGAFGPVTAEQNEYYITMRWNYAIWYEHPSERDSFGKPKTKTRNVDNQAMAWHRHKKILVTNPKNGRQIVTSVEDSGPAIWTGRISGLSTKGIQALGFRHGDCGMVLNYVWADQNAALGPVR